MLAKTTTLAAKENPTALQNIFSAWAKMIGRPNEETMRKQVKKPATSNAPFELLKFRKQKKKATEAHCN